MTAEINMARKAVHDKIEAEISSVQAKLESLRAEAAAAKADAELKMIAELLTKKQAVDRQVAELKKSSASAFQRAKADVQSRVAELQKSVEAIQAKLKTAQPATR